MPIVFVHGVGIREMADPLHHSSLKLTGGLEWPQVEQLLREHVAPTLNPFQPGAVVIERVYWGDLGAPKRAAPQEIARVADLAELGEDEFGEQLQDAVLRALPANRWPEAIEASWAVARDRGLRRSLDGLGHDAQERLLKRELRRHLPADAPGLTLNLSAFGRRAVRQAMDGIRRPGRDFVPLFLGDILRYVGGRGQAGAPGIVIRRVIDALHRAATGAGAEPLVVLTHSMGGQVLFDLLTAFGDELGEVRVDFWCASASQLGLFADLGVFLDPAAAGCGVPAERLGYLWNAWSSTDVLSFPAEGRVRGAHDVDFTFIHGPTANHMAYLSDPAFFRAMAAMIAVHAC
ncbi:hypothetical protein [Blastococcus sp. Marseille-P5729]|uniref:hypothetical protein n=1 Tax=Blastococcus sp. Marseille-P5729 TaxID=2086582 RepID=UPI0018FE7B1D|nr:hypothetical protein [Blastococcus sp. Marseille-P5729]